MGPIPWLIAGVVLLVAELVHNAFVVCWFGVAALLVAAASSLGMSQLASQLMLFAAASALLVVTSQALLKPWLRSRKGAPRTNVEALVGALGDAPSGVGLLPGEGRVQLQGLDWAARAADDRPIPRGARVRVVAVEGVTLVVLPEAEAAR